MNWIFFPLFYLILIFQLLWWILFLSNINTYYHWCLNIALFIFSIFRSTANAIQNYSFEAKTDDLPSLADKMSLLDIGPNVTKIPIERSNGSSGLVTKIPIERVDKGKYFTALLFFFLFLFHSDCFWGSNYQSEFFYLIIFLFDISSQIKVIPQPKLPQ